MFERFTDGARRVVVLAQEEARLLKHNYIGTEHLLLALTQDGDSLAGQALESLGISPEGVRSQVEQLIGQGSKAVSGHVPFTPRAKKVLELGLREALQLGHNYIGPEHILLGLVREGQGVGAQVLSRSGADLASVRETVTSLLGGPARPRRSSPHTPAGARIDRIARALAGDRPVGSDHYLLALAGDDESLGAKLLAAAGLDRAALEQLLGSMDRAGTSDELPEEAGARRTTLRVTGDAVEVRVEEPSLASALRQALAEREGSEAPELSMGSDDPAAASFPALWKAVTDSTRDAVSRLGGQPEPVSGDIRSLMMRHLRSIARRDAPRTPGDT